MSSTSCIYCAKECKSSDSRPYPNSKSKERIHNKCQIKKSLADKKQSAPNSETSTDKKTPITASFSLKERFLKDEEDLNKIKSEKTITKLEESNGETGKQKDSNSGQFFFDLKAGIAKPHEKRTYLHHRKVSEIANRYDDHGFQQESAGRSYDHTGRDLNSLGASDDEDSDQHDDSKDDDISQSQSSNKRKHYGDDQDCSREKKSTRIKLDETNPCWFCLSSAKVEKHLIIAIGEHCYLTLAKGGITDNHLLILPINHIQSINDNKANYPELLEELELFKNSLVKFFGSQSQGVVFYERNFRSVHWQLQVVPIDLNILDTIEQDIKSMSEKHFKNSNYLDIPAKYAIGDIIPQKAPYIYWQIEPLGTRFVMQINVKGTYFPLQLGRLILTDEKILNCSEKIDWKSCTKSEEEYKQDVRAMKERYKPYDCS